MDRPLPAWFLGLLLAVLGQSPVILCGDKVRRQLEGEPYPTYSSVPRTSFSCDVQGPGYYADMETSCQIFHICHANIQDSFICPEGTVFNQRSFVCDWWYNVDCPGSADFYSLNNRIGSSLPFRTAAEAGAGQLGSPSVARLTSLKLAEGADQRDRTAAGQGRSEFGIRTGPNALTGGRAQLQDLRVGDRQRAAPAPARHPSEAPPSRGDSPGRERLLAVNLPRPAGRLGPGLLPPNRRRPSTAPASVALTGVIEDNYLSEQPPPTSRPVTLGFPLPLFETPEVVNSLAPGAPHPDEYRPGTTAAPRQPLPPMNLLPLSGEAAGAHRLPSTTESYGVLTEEVPGSRPRAPQRENVRPVTRVKPVNRRPVEQPVGNTVDQTALVQLTSGGFGRRLTGGAKSRPSTTPEPTLPTRPRPTRPTAPPTAPPPPPPPPSFQYDFDRVRAQIQSKLSDVEPHDVPASRAAAGPASAGPARGAGSGTGAAPLGFLHALAGLSL